MRRIRDCLRLHYEGRLNQSEISCILKIARSTVQEYISRLAISKLTYDETKRLSDADLETKLFPPTIESSEENTGKEVDCEYLHKELKRTGVTLRLLWEEYRKQNPDGYAYSQFCWYYQQWRNVLKVYMRQPHKAGERVYADYSGKKPSIVNRFTGEIQEVELLVMCWGCSQYTYAEAQPSQQLKYWIMGHVRAFEYFGCVPKLVVPDNAKCAVTKAHRYDPDVNPTYTELSEYYGFGVLPARPASPRDKAKVESGVQIVQRWILARLRNQVFHSIEELNHAIRLLLEDLNSRLMQKLHQSRKEFFKELDLPNASSLPEQPFTYRQWYTPTVNLDYHVEIEKRYYSVPWKYYGKKVSACLADGVLSIFQNENRIAIHNELKKPYTYSTQKEHMPLHHQSCYDWSTGTVISKAREIGPSTEALIKKIIALKQHPQQGFRPSQGILRLAESYGKDRLEAASRIALTYSFTRVEQVSSILKNGKDLPTEESTATVENVNNVRGQNYYAQKEGN